jgi:hypothetical protein
VPGAPMPGDTSGDFICADTDATRYEIENKENIIKTNNLRVIFFMNFLSSN